MPTRLVRRASLTALVFAALSAPAFAQTTPPGPPGDQGPRMERDRGHRMHHGDEHHGRMQMHRRMEMRGGFGGMPAMLGIVPLRPGQEFRFSEGRLAFLKAELKITEAQTKAWDAIQEAQDFTAQGVAAMEAEPIGPGRPAKKGLAPRLLINRLKSQHDSPSDHAPDGGGLAWPTCALRNRVKSGASVCLTGGGRGPSAQQQDAWS